MQRVVRSTFVGLLTLAGLTACGDKVTVPGLTTTPVGTIVHSVTVSPQSATLRQAVAPNPTGANADKITLGVSVDADAGVTDRTVTWTSSNTAIASVDAAGVVTAGTTAGVATIVAASKATPSVTGAAVITVTPATGSGGTPATISIQSINQTLPGVGSVPANLGNVVGQLDVTLNVDAGSSVIKQIDLIMNCNAAGNFPAASDSIVASSTPGASNVVAAEAASAPVTLSFNTARFNEATGAPSFKNGQCVIKSKLTTTSGGSSTTTSTQSSASLNLTLANPDVVLSSTGIVPSNSKINPVTNLSWSGGVNSDGSNATVTIKATPIFYSGRIAAKLFITFEGVTDSSLNASTTVPMPQASFVFTDGNGTASIKDDINGKTDAAALPTVAVVDAAGASVTTANCVSGAVNTICTAASVLGAPLAPNPTPIAALRLDTQKPVAGSLALNPNTLQGTITSWVNGNFRFVADSAAGFVGPNAGSAVGAGTTCLGNANGLNPVTCNLDNAGGTQGVDSVTVKFFSTTSTSSSAVPSGATPITSPANLAETVTNSTNALISVTTDLLGNADTSFATGPVGAHTRALSQFGVDKTAPAVTTTGAADLSTGAAVGSTGQINATVTDGLSGPAAQQLVAQVVLNSAVTATSQPANNTIYTNTGAAGTSAVNTAPTSGCIIGRFNRTSGAANADPAALPIFTAAGTQIGTCSPTPYILQGGTTVQTNMSGTQAYVTTSIVPIDQAGNRAATKTIHVVEDATNPVVGALDLPTSISGGSSPVIPAAVTENLDVTSSAVQLSYNGAGPTLQYPAVAGPGVAFDNSLQPGSTTTAGTVLPVIQVFARNLQSGAAAPTNPNQAANGPLNVNVGAADEVGRHGASGNVNLTATTIVTQPGSTSPWATTFTGTTTIAANNATVSVCPTAGCTNNVAPANPTTTTLTVTAQGTSSTFANPFTTVQIWFQPGGAGPWFLAGTTGAGTSRDTGPTGSRFWDYAFTWTPPKGTFDYITGNQADFTVSGTTANVIGIGLNSTGDGIFTAAVTITFSNP